MIRRDGRLFYVEIDGEFFERRGPFSDFETANACLQQWQEHLQRSRTIAAPYERALRRARIKKLISTKTRDPERERKIRAELIGFTPPPLLEASQTFLGFEPPAAPTKEQVLEWQVRARGAANRHRRARAAKARQAKAAQAARPVKQRQRADTDARIVQALKQARGIPERNRARHVASMLGLSAERVRRVMRSQRT